MREIKFKLWHKGFKKFFTTNYSDQISMMPDGNIFWMGECETDNFTLLQYTGLKDKNGKEIYEGDIAKSGKRLFIARWNNDIASFFWEPLDGESSYPCFNVGTVKNVEIVGNIYENPELLEETK